MSRCPGNHPSGNHHFQPRYSYGACPPVPAQGRTQKDVLSFIEAMTPKTYHGDVCVHCGAVVNKR